ncbi:hypothetical protein [Haliangium sp.]|uniref:hypothetical protein n=1 Tax=Haliangium sp. TaxID=2663208 RepID=UPI003D13ABF5
MHDAAGIRSVLRDAWDVDEDETYFYSSFNDVEAVFRDLVEPTNRTADLRDLDAVCLVGAAADGRIVATTSLVLDHVRRTVELGRAAVARDAGGGKIMLHFEPCVHALLALIPDYSIIADSTTLSRTVAGYALLFDAQAVALHPSSFTVQQSCVQDWWKRLARVHGDEVAHALLLRSEVTGLGRFATGYHVRPPVGITLAEPCLTALQRRFCTHTRRTLGRLADVRTCSASPQRSQVRSQKVCDRRHTATRTITETAADIDPRAVVRAAARAGFEVVIARIRCDLAHLGTSRRLEAAGALLCGVFPDSSGDWHASYMLFTSAEHRARALDSLRLVCENGALAPCYGALARLVLEQADRRVPTPAHARRHNPHRRARRTCSRHDQAVLCGCTSHQEAVARVTLIRDGEVVPPE